MLVFLFVLFGVCLAQHPSCTDPCGDPCTVEAEGSDVTVDLVGKSGQIKLFRGDDENHIKLKLDKIEERDAKNKKVAFINNLASIDAEWCEPTSDGSGDDEAVSIQLFANDGDVDIDVVVNLDNSVIRSRCCFSGDEPCVDPIVRAEDPADDEDRPVSNCKDIDDAVDGDCLIEDADGNPDCSGCRPTNGDGGTIQDPENPDDDTKDVNCDAERVALGNSALKWSIVLDKWQCEDDTNINFGWNIQSPGGGGDFADCSGCGSEDCGGDDQPDCCGDIDEVTCSFDGGSVSFPTTVVLTDNDDADVVAVSFDGNGSNFGVTVVVPCSDHIDYDPEMSLTDGVAVNSAFGALVLAVAVWLWN